MAVWKTSLTVAFFCFFSQEIASKLAEAKERQKEADKVAAGVFSRMIETD